MQTHNHRSLAIFAALAVLALASMACSVFGVDITNQGATLTISLKENEINRMLKESNDRVEDRTVILREITSVDLHDGYLRIFGTYEKQDGHEAEGSYDVKFETQGGDLQAEIIGVDIEGVELGDERIQQLNEEIADSLAKSNRENHGEVEYQSVSVTEDDFTMVVKTYWEK